MIGAQSPIVVFFLITSLLQAKAIKFKQQGASTRDKTLTSTDAVGSLAGIPIVSGVVNALNANKTFRGILEDGFGVHRDAKLPRFHSKPLRRRVSRDSGADAEAAGPTTGKVALFATCYGNRNDPQSGEDLVAVFRHNGIAVTTADKEKCCGMPKLELGDLEAVTAAKEANINALTALIDDGWDIVTPIPSCTLMFKQELPLMFPQDADVQKVKNAMFDPFEYLMLRHKYDKLNTNFSNTLGKVAYQVPCHLRVQNIGLKTRDMLQLVPDTEVDAIERCSGHDGTYAVKSECHDISMKICRPVVNRVARSEADHYSSDCPMAGHQIENGLRDGSKPEHPMSLLRMAYGI